MSRIAKGDSPIFVDMKIGPVPVDDRRLQKLPTMRRLGKRSNRRKFSRRAGAASLDYVLVLAVILPMVAFIMFVCKGHPGQPGILQLTYEMVCALVSWPFM
jgi:hypothetical protein